jgi:hypothetical protein
MWCLAFRFARNLVAATFTDLGYTSVRLGGFRFCGMRFAASADIEEDEASLVCTWGETNGGLSLVWVSYIRINLDAGASVLGRAQ